MSVYIGLNDSRRLLKLVAERLIADLLASSRKLSRCVFVALIAEGLDVVVG
jgi:hypothetical protein